MGIQYLQVWQPVAASLLRQRAVLMLRLSHVRRAAAFGKRVARAAQAGNRHFDRNIIATRYRGIECLLIADDLTGACDAAVCFAMRGRRTTVSVADGAGFEGASVVAISTESRDVDSSAAGSLISAVAARLPAISPRLLFKKIDSTLRGHAGVEIAAALDAFDCDAAVVCPAFPAMSRIVSAGRLRVTGDVSFSTIDVTSYLRKQGIEHSMHVKYDAVVAAISSGARAIVIDAVHDEDLDRIAGAGLASGLRILWAGSAGLAAALARTLHPTTQSRRRPVATAPLLFCLGSNHPVTVAQEVALVRRMRVPVVHAEGTTREAIDAELRQGRHVVLRIPRGAVPKEQLKELLPSDRVSAVVLSGGDTASLFCQAAGVEHIDLVDEVLPGIPFGIICGGAFDGIPVVTKSGGFGDADALIQVAVHFSCPN
jgi:D-threonate/D-erythronate kinase